MASLMVSQMLPIRSFGAYSAAGLTLTTVLLLTMLPALLATWPPRRRSVPTATQDGVDHRSGGIWTWLAAWLSRYHAETVLVAVVLMVGCGLGIRHLTTSVRIQTLFASDSRIIQDYAWLEKHLGPLVPIEVVVTCDQDCQLALRDRLLLLWKLGCARPRKRKLAARCPPFSCCPPFRSPARFRPPPTAPSSRSC